MRFRRIHIYSLFGLFLCLACEVDSCLHGTGNSTSLKISTGYYNEAEVYGLFEVILIEDSANFVEFEGGEKVLEYVKAEVIDSTLIIDNNNSCFYLRSYDKIKVNIHYSLLNKFVLKEASKLVSEGALSQVYFIQAQGEMAEIDVELNASRFNFYNHTLTGGSYTFRGYVENCHISNYYTARCDLKQLQTKNLYLDNSSLSDIYVNAEENLRVQILNHGNVYYSGSPEITIDSLNGQGELLPWVE